MIQSDLPTLKRYLPKGWASSLSKKHNLSEDMIRKIIRGERINIPVIETATTLAEDHKNKLLNLSRRIKQIS